MSRNYDNWERLVAAVLKRDQLWHLFHAQSSPSISSESSGFSFSFGMGSSIEDAPVSSPEWSPDAANHNQRDDDIGSSSSRVHVKDLPQPPVEIENQSLSKNVTSKPFWKRALKIEVPKVRGQHHGNGSAKDTSHNNPKTSPTTTLLTPGSSDHSASVTPRPPRAGKGVSESPTNWPDSATQACHPLPLPPPAVSNSSAEPILSMPWTPERVDRLQTYWKKGKLLDRSATGDVYLGFNSEKGAMCAMKEVSLSRPSSKEMARTLELEIGLLSTLSHPNIVQYYGSEMVGDKFYIYCEYMSAGSVVKILKQYGKLGEPAIRSYTKQILSGLTYLHSKNIAHRAIKGAHILVDSNGIVKLSHFGTEQHLSRQLHSSMLTDILPYWTAPEVIMNSSACNLHMDIWSLGCTVVEMATSAPPMSQYEMNKAMFKIASKKELPAIPDHLSDEGKDFLKRCFQWNPLRRAPASQLLEHPFVRRSLPLVKSEVIQGIADVTNHHQLDSGTRAIHISRASKSNHQYTPHLYSNTDIHTPRRYISASVSPVRSPLPHPNSPRHLNGQTSPSPVSSPPTASPSSTPHRIRSIAPREMLCQKSPPSIINIPSYWNPNILRGSQHSGSRVFLEKTPSDRDNVGKKFRRATNEEPVLDVRLPQHLLRAPAKLNPYLI